MKRKSLIACGASLSALLIANGALAQQRTFDVPAGPATKSIPEFARQAGIQIIAPAYQLTGVVTPPVKGVHDARAALNELISGTNLEISSDDGVRIALRSIGQKSDAVVPTASSLAGAAPPERIDVVVVTGSRLITNGNDSPMPVTMISADQLFEFQPSNIADGLNTLPGILGSTNSTSSPQSTQVDTLNLRGVGTLRGLVLFDGHRVGPTQGGGATTIDVIPQILLQRVDVVTGGASAVYGSDAVSGVVNFITINKFNGVKLNLADGVSNFGDDAKANIGIAVGHNVLGDRGHLEASYEYRSTPGTTFSARPFLVEKWTEQGSLVNGGNVGLKTNPFILTQGAVLATVSFGGLINSGPLSGLNFTQNGQLSPFVHGTPTGTSGIEVGGQGAYYTGASIATAEDVQQEFARFDYNFTSNIRGFIEATASQERFSYTQQNLLLSKVAIGYNNPFLSSVQAQYQPTIVAELAANPLGSFQLSKMDTLYPDAHLRIFANYDMVVSGLEGSVGKYDWDFSYTHTDSQQHSQNDNGVDNGRLYAALDAVVNPANGQIVCNAALVNPAVYGGCIPLNVFGPTSENAAALNYIRHVPHSAQLYNSDDVTATFKGAPFNLPAGLAAMALSGEWRRLNYQVQSDSPPTTPVSCVGIQFNCTSTLTPYQGGQTTVLAPVSQMVGEVAYEANLPILADAPFAEAFNVNGAARFTDYNTSGGVLTWKVGGDWKIDDEFTVRATQSRDIRAPNLSELFAPPSSALAQYVDIHTGASGPLPQISRGNPNLKPEIADTTTAGIVWRPNFARGFSLSIDAYRVLINSAIVSIQAFQPATQTACEASGGAAQVCSLYARPLPFSNATPANFPLTIANEALNVASLETYGVDIEGNYATRMFGRQLILRALFNWQPHLVYNNGPAGIVDVGGAADGVAALPIVPATKLVLSAGYQISETWVVHLQERWRGPLRQNGSAGLYFADGMVRPIGYTDLAFDYAVNKSLSAFFNVQNLFNAAPPPWASSGGSVQPGYQGGYAPGDDIIGRYLTLGLRLRL